MMAPRRKLIAAGQMPPAKAQITRPCTDCPMARNALPGWLGGATPEEYARLSHSDALVSCHVHGNVQCAGMAIYRRNVCKRVDPPGLVLPADREAVFATPMEFLAHHQQLRGAARIEAQVPDTSRGGAR